MTDKVDPVSAPHNIGPWEWAGVLLCSFFFFMTWLGDLDDLANVYYVYAPTTLGLLCLLVAGVRFLALDFVSRKLFLVFWYAGLLFLCAALVSHFFLPKAQ